MSLSVGLVLKPLGTLPTLEPGPIMFSRSAVGFAMNPAFSESLITRAAYVCVDVLEVVAVRLVVG
jgi:hypothetical protein